MRGFLAGKGLVWDLWPKTYLNDDDDDDHGWIGLGFTDSLLYFLRSSGCGEVACHVHLLEICWNKALSISLRRDHSL